MQVKKTILFISLICVTLLGFSQIKSDRLMPISTQWTLDAAGPIDRFSIPNIFLVYCPNIDSKGSGFQLKSGVIITCAHVIKNSEASEIICFDAYGIEYRFIKVIADTVKDLAILITNKKLIGGLSLGSEDSLKIGRIVSTWGFPLGHNGPPPILSVGYLAGFTNRSASLKDTIKQLVINGAFNPGNSGGPLFMANSNKVIGIVVSKYNPLLSKLENSAIKALAENKSGVTFNYTHSDGKAEVLVESQVVASLLNTYKRLNPSNDR